jgi:tripartite-type tricarboxylate transporter receptor subunit TctC
MKSLQNALPVRRILAAVLAAAGLGAMACHAAAQSYPTQTVRIIVPQPAGGVIDTAARLVQPQLEKSLGQSVIVDNRPGAAGIVGTDAVAKAPPDGHTLLVVAGSLTSLPATHPKLPYDTERDLAPVGLILKYPFHMFVPSTLPAKTLPEFIALLKQEPGKYNYATTGPASLNHLISEHLLLKTGTKMQHIPYRGGAQSMLAVAKGEAHMIWISAAVAAPHLQAGTVRAIATGGLARDKQFPDLPTAAEQGLPGFEAVSWVGMFAPAGTPKAVIERLNAEVNRAVGDPATAAKLTQQGSDPGGGPSEELQRMVATEVRNWTEVARAANITTQ